MISKKSVQGSKTAVTFIYNPDNFEQQTAFLVGDFNDWDETAMPMNRWSDGSFRVTVLLEAYNEYQFRYLVNGQWQNDLHADKYVPSPFSGDNSVVVI
ncbi:glycoside hydrolase [Candidatus Microgenomates bacterium]|nr:MAG: glycoside hydrolase [Candidatus Microgenomates bacterium]